MSENILARIIEQNNWANQEIIRACAALSDAQLDAAPTSATKGDIRHTLWHMISSQQGYLNILTGVKKRLDRDNPPSMDEIRELARSSGEALRALARGEAGEFPTEPIITSDGYSNEPWVVMVQVINHATEHREQIKSMLSSLGVEPPDVDAWVYGESIQAVFKT
jgi:uncharacterized damage-inducible protein DinB